MKWMGGKKLRLTGKFSVDIIRIRVHTNNFRKEL